MSTTAEATITSTASESLAPYAPYAETERGIVDIGYRIKALRLLFHTHGVDPEFRTNWPANLATSLEEFDTLRATSRKLSEALRKMPTYDFSKHVWCVDDSMTREYSVGYYRQLTGIDITEFLRSIGQSIVADLELTIEPGTGIKVSSSVGVEYASAETGEPVCVRHHYAGFEPHYTSVPQLFESVVLNVMHALCAKLWEDTETVPYRFMHIHVVVLKAHAVCM